MDGMYRKDEIKSEIDYVCQKSMYENYDNKDQTWNIILALQRELYERFDLID